MPREPERTIIVPAGFTIQDFGKGRGGGYRIDGQKVDGVTTVLDNVGGGKEGMSYKAMQIGLAGVSSLLNTDVPLSRPYSAQDFESALRREKLLHTDAWEAKRELGDDTHKVLEALCTPEGVFPIPDEDDPLHPYVDAVCRWYEDHDPEEVFSELIVGSPVHGYAGKADLLYRLNGQLVVADLKTSKAIYPQALIQVAAYALAAEESGYGTADRLEVIWAKPDGSYSVFESKCGPDDFMSCLAAYRAYKATDKDLKAAVKELQAAA